MEKKNTHVAYGAITGVVMVIIGLVAYVTGIAFNPAMRYIGYIPFLIGIILNAMAFSKQHDGFVTFGNVFGSCFKAVMIVALVMVLWSIVSLFAFPEMKQKAMEIAQENLVKNKMSDDQIEKSMAFMRKGYGTLIIASTVFGTLIVGAIFSLIAAGVVKKKGSSPFGAQA
jgi:uncharacterized membrane protein